MERKQLEGMKVHALRRLAMEHGIAGTAKMTKKILVEELAEALP